MGVFIHLFSLELEVLNGEKQPKQRKETNLGLVTYFMFFFSILQLNKILCESYY